ncbi:MAG: hypothetical protein RJB13_1480, partial [Pseudomonadota bacterium]
MRTNIIQALFVFLFLNSSSSYAFLGCINSSK